MKRLTIFCACLTLLCGMTACAPRETDNSGSETDGTTVPPTVTTADTNTSDTTAPKDDKVKIIVNDTSKNYKAATIAWATIADYTENGDAFDFTFKIKDNAPEGDYEIFVYETETTDQKYEPVEMDAINGKIKVAASGEAEAEPTAEKFTLSMGTAAGAPGSEVKLNAKFLNNTGICGASIVLYYDGDALELTDAAVANDKMRTGLFIPNLTLDAEFVKE